MSTQGCYQLNYKKKIETHFIISYRKFVLAPKVKVGSS